MRSFLFIYSLACIALVHVASVPFDRDLGVIPDDEIPLPGNHDAHVHFDDTYVVLPNINGSEAACKQTFKNFAIFILYLHYAM